LIGNGDYFCCHSTGLQKRRGTFKRSKDAEQPQLHPVIIRGAGAITAQSWRSSSKKIEQRDFFRDILKLYGYVWLPRNHNHFSCSRPCA
jgi:hypothetical protein